MQVKVPLTTTGYLPDVYSKHAEKSATRGGFPIISPPITISDLPAGTVSLALTFLDFDAVPVGGFVWIHWLAANIKPDGDRVEIPENASQSGQFDFSQGRNSNAGKLVNVTDPKIYQHYVGPQPPNQDHDYQLTVYALKKDLDLENGYWLNAFYQQIDSQVLDAVTVHVLGRV